jgi:Raf kinase inhibitor-like YbhB/YbcL family protein
MRNTIVRITLCLSMLLLTLSACQAAPAAESAPQAAAPVEAAATNPPAVENQAKPSEELSTPEEVPGMSFQITSSAFSAGSAIPAIYSCKGKDMSPPLAWGQPPAGTASLVLIMDDPDAPVGTWDHWVVFNLPASLTGLQEGASTAMPAGAVTGRNSWKRSDYGGPCPPGGTHRYFFKLYALDTTLNLTDKANKKDVETAMSGHILLQTELIGTFSK